jgi:predicted dehydrogenase
MTKNVRIGFIGAGGISAGHFERLRATGQADVVALTEPNPTALKNLYKRCPDARGIAVYSDYETMLNEVALDGVLVMSPHAFHYEQTRAALRQGLHVLSEKPLVCNSTEARNLIRLAKKSGRVLSLSYQRHYDPLFRYMRSEIQKGRLGDIQFIQAMQAQEWLRLTRGSWRQVQKISGGGQLNDSGSHLIDIVLWVTGLDVSEVFAQGECFDAEVDINSAITLKFSNGALGNLSVIGNAPTWHEDHTIIGSKGAFFLRQDGTLLQQGPTGKPRKVRLPKYNENPDSNFVGCILGKSETETPPECGLATIRATEAMWRSMERGKPVRLRPLAGA